MQFKLLIMCILMPLVRDHQRILNTWNYRTSTSNALLALPFLWYRDRYITREDLIPFITFPYSAAREESSLKNMTNDSQISGGWRQTLGDELFFLPDRLFTREMCQVFSILTLCQIFGALINYHKYIAVWNEGMKWGRLYLNRWKCRKNELCWINRNMFQYIRNSNLNSLAFLWSLFGTEAAFQTFN